MGGEGFSGSPVRAQALRLRREIRERPPRERSREDVAVAGSGTEMVNETGSDGVSTSAPPDVGKGPEPLKDPEYVAGVEMSGETGATADNMKYW